MRTAVTAVLSMLFLQGCLNFTQITTIKKDKTGEMFIHWWIKWENIDDTLSLNRIHIFNKDTIKSRFNASFTTIENIEVYTVYDDSSQHGKIKFEFTNFDSLINLPVFANTDLSIINGPEETQIFSQNVLPIVTSFGFNFRESRIRYVYYLPGKILNHNAHKISRNKLTWEFSSGDIIKGKEISATYRPFRLKETPKIIYYLAIFVLLVVVVFLFKKRK